MFSYTQMRSGSWVVVGEASALAAAVGTIVSVATLSGKRTRHEVIGGVGKSFPGKGPHKGTTVCYGYPDRTQAARDRIAAHEGASMVAEASTFAARTVATGFDGAIIESKRAPEAAPVVCDAWEEFRAQLLSA